jgi:hypothetical protein
VLIGSVEHMIACPSPYSDEEQSDHPINLKEANIDSDIIGVSVALSK